MATPVPLDASHVEAIYRVVNDAATAYRGHIPPDCYPDPYMPRAELVAEMAEMQFYGCFDVGRLVAVMGVQDIQDVTLLRHAYVETARQGQGLGTALLRHVEAAAGRPTILVGTWAAATWAIAFYQAHGYALVADRAAKDALLRRYWHVPDRQIATSVVLRKSLANDL
jgi:GNAT superfamily N-acetyltransferase